MYVPCYVTNDHYWRGGSICTECGERLRCYGCGQFVREDSLDQHLDKHEFQGSVA